MAVPDDLMRAVSQFHDFPHRPIQPSLNAIKAIANMPMPRNPLVEIAEKNLASEFHDAPCHND